MAKDLLLEVGEEVAEDDLILRHPGTVIRIDHRHLVTIIGLLLGKELLWRGGIGIKPINELCSS
jgi:hypothetical protein